MTNRFRVIQNRRSGFWEVRETVGRRSVLRGRRLTRQGADQAAATLQQQVDERERLAGRRS